ncbi:hypothetical protein N9E28_02745, partial [Alphaproteobacteria bacterium]|nr:hypothetical protein [Alphaproteobacteria bacterium]
LQRICFEMDDEPRWLIALLSDTGMRLAQAVGLLSQNIELRMFASKERDIEFSNQLISRVDQKAKSLMKSAAHVTVKLEFSPVTYLTGFHDPKITSE